VEEAQIDPPLFHSLYIERNIYMKSASKI